MMGKLLAVVVSIMAMSAGCGSGGGVGTVTQTVVDSVGSITTSRVEAPSESPQEFIEQMLGLAVKDQAGPEWDHLHPGQKRFVARQAFEDCRSQVTIPQFDHVSVVDVYDDPISIVGVPERSSKAVTLKLTVGDQSVNQTFHAVLHDGRWTWVLPASDVAAYKAGQCPE